jgi:hypothetical protein
VASRDCVPSWLAPPRPALPRERADVRKGFVYKRLPHVTLKSIANPDIREGMSRQEIDAAITRHADSELLYDQPYEDKGRVRARGRSPWRASRRTGPSPSRSGRRPSRRAARLTSRRCSTTDVEAVAGKGESVVPGPVLLVGHARAVHEEHHRPLHVGEGGRAVQRLLEQRRRHRVRRTLAGDASALAPAGWKPTAVTAVMIERSRAARSREGVDVIGCLRTRSGHRVGSEEISHRSRDVRAAGR